MRAPRASCLAAVLACTGLLTACGHTQRVGASRTVSVAVSEYRLRPDNIRVSAGYLDIHVHNYGRLTHNLVIFNSGQNEGSTSPIWPGQSAELTVSLPPGTYSIASTMLSDEALGAYGTLTVTK